MTRFLAIDIGNSSVKLTLFLDGKIILSASSDYDLSATDIDSFKAEKGICSSVADDESTHKILARIKENICDDVKMISSDARLPIKINYEPLRNLGLDRIAAAVGAVALYPEEPLLVVDAGTAITADIIDDKATFIGGTISPGISLRFRSLNNMTARLPLVAPSDSTPLVGNNTCDAIRAGVEWGIVNEIRGLYNYAVERFGMCRPIITGGDALLLSRLASKNNFKLQVADSLVAYGLYRIYEHNENK